MTQFQERITNISRRRVGDILPNERNPKQPTEQKQERLTAVLSQFGKAGVLLTYYDDHGVERFFDGNTRRGLDPDDEWYIAQTDLSQKEVDDLVMLYDPLAEPDWEPELLKMLAAETAVEGVLGDMLDEIVAELGQYLQMEPGQWDNAFGGLPDEDRAPFQQMTFTLHDTQAEQVKAALSAAGKMGTYDSPNENSNGNALARICETFITDYGNG